MTRSGPACHSSVTRDTPHGSKLAQKAIQRSRVTVFSLRPTALGWFTNPPQGPPSRCPLTNEIESCKLIASERGTFWGGLLRAARSNLRSPDARIYLITLSLVLTSYMIWFRFDAPPVGSNSSFNLFPWRQVGLSTSLFDPYYWPGSFVPQALGTPYQAYYGVWFTLGGSSYAAGIFATIVPLDCLGGLCLSYFLLRWLRTHGVSAYYCLIGALVYSFNVYKTLSGYGTYGGYFSLGPFSAGDPALLLVLVFLTYWALFRSLDYALVLGAVTFLVFSYFPTGTLTLVEEYLVAFAVLLWYRIDSVRVINSAKGVRDAIVGGAATITSIVVANLYLAYPLALTGSTYTTAVSSNNPSYTFSYSFDTIETPANALRLVTNWWVLSPDAPQWARAYLTDPTVIALSWALPILALCGALFLRSKLDLVLLVVTVFSAISSFGSNPPFGGLFTGVIAVAPVLRPFFNGEYFSAPLVICYACLSSLAVGSLVRSLAQTNLSRRKSIIPLSSASRRTAAFIARHRRHSATVLIAALVTLLLVANLPALSPEFAAGTTEYPATSTLPSSYLSASSYLQSANPSAPVMVFPGVSPFTSLSTGGDTWYSGPNPYPDILANPSVSSSYAANYWGTAGTGLSIPGFVYESVGPSVCPSDSCRPQAQLLPQTQGYGNSSTDYVTRERSTINWTAVTAGDSLSISGVGNSTLMTFGVNLTNSHGEDHWLIGFLDTPLDLREFGYALINLSSTGVDASDLQFGFHSDGNYQNGSAYYLGSVTPVTGQTHSTYLLPLRAPSLNSSGNLANVSNLFFVYVPPANSTGTATVSVSSIRFVETPTVAPPRWTAATPGDSLNLTASGGTTQFSFRVNESNYVPGAHWAIGAFPSPANLSPFSFVALNYSLSNLDPAYIQFGFHSGSNGSGSAYVFSQFLTLNDGTNYTTLIPLDAPSLVNNGNISQVLNVFINYNPPDRSPQTGFINATAMSLSNGASSAPVLASDLARYGVEYALVDTGVGEPIVPGWNGDSYLAVFQNSSDFINVFHDGTLSIFKDLEYSGVFATSADVAQIPQTVGAIGGEAFDYVDIYYNLSDVNTTFVSPTIATMLPTLTPSTVTSLSSRSPTSYSIGVAGKGWSVLVFRETYSPAWQAVSSTGRAMPEHFEADGFDNAWLIPPGNYTIDVTMTGQTSYQTAELVAFLAPPMLLVVWAAPRVRRLTARARPRSVA